MTLRRVFPLFSAILLLTGSVALADDADSLQKMRSQRRSGLRAAQTALEKSSGPSLFGLLVIPVDFSDARLAPDWNPDALTDRLTSGSQESLHRYFKVASGGKLDLRVTQAPVVHLAGTRRDYSDIGWNGFSRTRALATESLEAVRDWGLEFRRLDMEGPDRIPGTDDDDGEIDGVLILHAGIGQENDTENGLVQALQFFLEDPVVSQGVNATFYAVASLHSGPGIWAHETAHLMGLEDRYDPGLRPSGGSEVNSLGGLGRFSLMASGAWGTGDGYGAALPDAYSCLQLGWYRARNLVAGGALPDTLIAGIRSGQVDRLWTRSGIGTEFFLLETRDPQTAFPFDADVPGNNLLIYHIDEALPEGRQQDDGDGTWHLKASLVEADDDFQLRRGEDDGRPEDLFPGPLGKVDFGPGTIPSSWGYDGNSQVSLSGITTVPGGVTFLTTVWPDQYLEMSLAFEDGPQQAMDLVARSTGTPLENLQCTVTALGSSTWGTFSDGGLSVSFGMLDDGRGNWRPDTPVLWVPDVSLPSSAHTTFRFDFLYDGGADSPVRDWYWKDNGDVLDFASTWPGQWSVEHPGNSETTWRRWDTGPWLTADQTPVLACTGIDHVDSSTWPDVRYGNSAHTILTSGPLGSDVRAVRLVHGLEVEYLSSDVAMDGGTVMWVGPGGQEIPAEPLAGWRGRIAEKAINVLHGQDALIQEDLELTDGIPLWRNEVIPVPEGLPGPWKLRLVFGSNTLWRHRGWFVASVDPVDGDPAEETFEGAWQTGSAGGLVWTWPWGSQDPARFIIQQRDPVEGSWTEVADEIFPYDAGLSGYLYPAARASAHLTGSVRTRHEMRVLGFIDKGTVATRDVVVFPDGGDGHPLTLSLPWPNPARGSVRIMAGVPEGNKGNLGIFDLRGRRVHERKVGTGSHLLEWSGRDMRGRRVAAGTYIIRLEGSGAAVMRKVVLLH